MAKRPAEDDDLADELFGDVPTAGSADGSAASKRKKKRRRKAGAADLPSRYMELEAEEADASEDEDDEPMSDLIDDTVPDPGEKGVSNLRKLEQQRQELEEISQDMASRGGDGGKSRFGMKLNEMEQKYKEIEEAQERGELPPDKTVSLDEIAEPPSPARCKRTGDSATFIVPDAKDPKLWCCKTFAPEKELCISLLMKAKDEFQKGNPVPIFSAFYSEHLRGYIYVEAWKEAEIRSFIKGIRGISPWAISLVPVAQMPQVFESAALDADKRSDVAKVGDWVRMKRGPYKEDLGQIDEVRDREYVVKLKPRIDFNIGKALDREAKTKRCRPVARWFNKHDVEAAGKLVNKEPRHAGSSILNFYVVEDEVYRDGYLYKTAKSNFFLTGSEVKPQEHELQDWRNCPPPSEANRPGDTNQLEDAKLMPPPIDIPVRKNNTLVERVPLVEGDVVICTKGDLKNLVGKVVKAITGQITVLVDPFVTMGMAKSKLPIATDRLSKYFEVGDHVKAVAGEHNGDAGTVVKVVLGPSDNQWSEKTMVVVLSSCLAKEFKCRVEHLRKSFERPEPRDAIGEFSVGQLVKAGREEVGVIIRLEVGQRAQLLLTSGEKILSSFGTLEPLARAPRYREFTWAPDRKGNPIKIGHTVLAPRGYKRTAPIKAEVKFIHGDVVFLLALEGLVGERAWLVCNANKCEFAYHSQKLEKVTPDTTSATQGQIQYGIQMASETNWLQPYAKRMLGLENPETTIKGAGVRIVAGSYKGLRGEVRQDMGTKFLVSLLSKPKLVEVMADQIRTDEHFEKKKKAERWPSCAPPTPILLDSAPGTPQSSITAPSGEDADERPPNEDESWDPKYLMSEERPASQAGEPLPALANKEGSQEPPSPSSSVAGASGELPRAPASPSTGRRKSRMPHWMKSESKQERKQDQEGAASAPQSPAHSPSSLDHEHRSPASFSHDMPLYNLGLPVVPQRASWLIRGAGVKFNHEGVDRVGWILNVYANMVVIAPDSADVGDDSTIYREQGSNIRPFNCSRRGQSVIIIDGPHRNVKGKAIGFDAGILFIRAQRTEHRAGEKIGLGSQVIRISEKDAVVYSEAWDDACQTNNLRSQRENSDVASKRGSHKTPSLAGSEILQEPPTESPVELTQPGTNLASAESSGMPMTPAEGLISPQNMASGMPSLPEDSLVASPSMPAKSPSASGPTASMQRTPADAMLSPGAMASGMPSAARESGVLSQAVANDLHSPSIPPASPEGSVVPGTPADGLISPRALASGMPSYLGGSGTVSPSARVGAMNVRSPLSPSIPPSSPEGDAVPGTPADGLISPRNMASGMPSMTQASLAPGHASAGELPSPSMPVQSPSIPPGSPSDAATLASGLVSPAGAATEMPESPSMPDSNAPPSARERGARR